jgi:hypothetical protein
LSGDLLILDFSERMSHVASTGLGRDELTLLFTGRIKRHRNTSNSKKAFTAEEQVLTPFLTF